MKNEDWVEPPNVIGTSLEPGPSGITIVELKPNAIIRDLSQTNKPTKKPNQTDLEAWINFTRENHPVECSINIFPGLQPEQHREITIPFRLNQPHTENGELLNEKFYRKRYFKRGYYCA